MPSSRSESGDGTAGARRAVPALSFKEVLSS